MRPCTPMPPAPAPRESAVKSVPHPAAPVRNPSQPRRHHLSSPPVQQLCTYVQSCGQTFFLFHRARRIFFLIKNKYGAPAAPRAAGRGVRERAQFSPQVETE